MEKIENKYLKIKDSSVKNTFGEITDPKIYTHPVFCQCVLPIKALPKEVRHYRVEHGNASLMFEAGCFTDPTTNKVLNQEVPAGAKARLLFSYIIDQAKRNDNPTIDMGNNLYNFMTSNKIPVGGKNAKEIVRQVRNIASADISLGISGETETHHFRTNEQFKIAKRVSFWLSKDVSQPQLWEPTLTLSDDFMSALSNTHTIIDLRPLIELQSSPRAMDMYMWLSYRIKKVNRPVKISYEDLHNIFGLQTKTLKKFKENFKESIRTALPYIKNANVDLDTDSKHIILKNEKIKVYLPPNENKTDNNDMPIEEGVFGELKAIGLKPIVIKKITKESEPEKIKKALGVTKESLKKGNIKNPAGFFTKALKEEWELINNESNEANEETIPVIDSNIENKITDADWKSVRVLFYQIKGIAVFNNWIKDLKLINNSNDCVILEAPTRFKADYIETNYKADLYRMWTEVTKKHIKIQIVC
ncbi:MAG: replication protein RepA [Proteobacteria bacterium]|nr:replication protein RepA [Pseudomonadota bacterium]